MSTKQACYFLFTLLLMLGCRADVETAHTPMILEETDSIHAPKLRRSGKIISKARQQDVYEMRSLDSLGFPIIDHDALAALEANQQLLQRAQGRRNYQIGGLRLTHGDLEEVIEVLRAWQHTVPLGLGQNLDAYQIWGDDRRGNVKFTGYFTPILKVSRKKGGIYQYPIYSRPLSWEGELPDREQIESGRALDGLGLKLAYATNKVDIYYMQLQGSGYVEYPDGSRELFAYNGTNRHPYRSIEKYIMQREDLDPARLSMAGIRSFLKGRPLLTDSVLFQNPSYVFFMRRRLAMPTGAGTVPLHPDRSIAVDRRYIPLGSCLLAAYPIFDQKEQRVTHHEYRLLFAQDVGGAIRGPGHVDYYVGVGEQAGREAGQINAYGQLWLLLPKARVPRAIITSSAAQ